MYYSLAASPAVGMLGVYVWRGAHCKLALHKACLLRANCLLCEWGTQKRYSNSPSVYKDAIVLDLQWPNYFGGLLALNHSEPCSFCGVMFCLAYRVRGSRRFVHSDLRACNEAPSHWHGWGLGWFLVQYTSEFALVRYTRGLLASLALWIFILFFCL